MKPHPLFPALADVLSHGKKLLYSWSGTVFRSVELEFGLAGNMGSWEVGGMKTTLEIPDDIFREAKAMAVLEGVKLKDFVAESLRQRVDAKKRAAAEPRRRVQLPIVRSAQPGSMKLTGEMIAEYEADLDAGRCE